LDDFNFNFLRLPRPLQTTEGSSEANCQIEAFGTAKAASKIISRMS